MEQNPSHDPGDVARRWIEAINAQDLDGIVDCFHREYEDEAPARPGEVVRGPDEVRANFERMFTELSRVGADLLALVTREDEVWMEWRLYGTRRDGSPMEFRGVNIFRVADGRFSHGRIYTELVREAGGIEGQVERMTKAGDESPP